MTPSTSLPELLEELRTGTISVGEHVTAILGRVDQFEPEIRSLLPEDGRAERLRTEAQDLQERQAGPDSPALLGAVVGIKDIFHVDGFPTRAGSQLPPEALAGRQASVASAVLDKGAIVLGKTVSTEFAYFAPGPTRNPRHLAHTPGGSSSGSAAAVAAGLCDFALGSQTIGSVIRPASFCGVVGCKPSFGRVPIDGVIPLAPSFDHVGWFTTDAAGARLVAGQLIEAWQEASTVGDPHLAIPAGPYLSRAGELARRQADRAISLLASSGLQVQTVAVMTDFDDIATRHQLVLAAEAAQVHQEWFRRFGGEYHERTAQLIRDGQKINPSELADARRGQARLRDQLHAAMDRAKVDLWVAPSTVGPAPRGLESTGDPVMNLPWTQAGMPVLTLPIGVDADGLPLGLQLIARAGDDERLLAWAERLEALLLPMKDPHVTGVATL
ncbi:MAG TPA: amidase [Anaerolineales bacterium]|nr:amidase [Anaerolineales bacterium]